MRGTTAVLYAQPVKQIISFIVTVTLARLLSPDDYGAIAASQTLVGFLAMFSGVGLYEAAVQKATLSDAEADVFFLLNLLVGVVLFLLSALSASFLADFYGSDELKKIVPVLSASFLLSSLGQVHASILAREQQFKKLIALELSGQAIAALVAILMAVGGCGYWSLVALSLIVVAVPSAGSWLVCAWRPQRANFELTSPIMTSLRFGVAVSAGNWLNYISSQIDRVLIGRMYQMGDLGLYNRAHQLGTYPNNLLFVGPHRFVTARLSRCQGNINNYKTELIRILSVALWGAVLINTMIAINSKALVTALFGHQWIPMHSMLTWISVGNAAYVLAFSYQWLHISRGTGRAYVKANLVRMVVMLAAVAIGINWGVLGVSIAYAIAIWTVAALSAQNCAKHTEGGLWQFLKPLLVPAVFALTGAIISAVVYPFADSSIHALIVRTAIILAIYISMSALLYDRVLKEAYLLVVQLRK